MGEYTRVNRLNRLICRGEIVKKGLLLLALVLPTLFLGIWYFRSGEERSNLDGLCKVVTDFDWTKHGGRGSGEAEALFHAAIDKNLTSPTVRNIWDGATLHGSGFGRWELILAGAYQINYKDFKCPALQSYLTPDSKDQPDSPQDQKKDLISICKISDEFDWNMYADRGLADRIFSANVLNSIDTFEVAQLWTSWNTKRNREGWVEFQSQAKKLQTEELKCPKLEKYFVAE